MARRFIVSGDVQGVGFRFFTQRVAARHQVTGYVRNLADGRVEAYAEGTPEGVEGFKHDISAGPRHARVAQVEETAHEPTGHHPSFRIEK
ncbi:MAG TPA: acylphosphatase [Pyrinomonadaceae bacterium]|nr:acylphosphatase [Pyrinomonadaceae bacterium]